ncbi:MAG: sugar phosphate isomerase/epimerase, partial [Bryobacteraceae bacterium]
LMKDRIRSTHVHDNDGERDSHLFPTLAAGGTIPWKDLVPLLRERADQFPLLLELKESPEFPNPLEAARRAADNLESL